MELLRESMKGDEERAKEIDAQSEKEIMFRSMTALEAIQAQFTKGQLGFEMELGAEGQQLSENTIKMLQHPIIDGIQEGMKASAVTLREVLQDALTPDAGSEAAVDAAWAESFNSFEQGFAQTFGPKWEQYIDAAIAYFGVDVAPTDDYLNTRSYGDIQLKWTG